MALTLDETEFFSLRATTPAGPPGTPVQFAGLLERHEQKMDCVFVQSPVRPVKPQKNSNCEASSFVGFIDKKK